jgi:hypothetical protein
MNRICVGVLVVGVFAACGPETATDAGEMFIHRTVLFAPNDAGDDFASTVGISGDGKTLAIATTDVGLVYIYVFDGASWEPQAGLSVDAKWGGFGRGVALNEDGSVLAVTADFESLDAGNSKDGAVYVFKRTGTTWAQDGHLSNPTVETSAHFGGAISLTRDGAELAIASTGGVYVYERTSTGWAPQSTVAAHSAPLLTGDGQTLVLNGWRPISLGDAGTTLFGTARVFKRDAGAWEQENEVLDVEAGILTGNLALSRDGASLLRGVVTEEQGAVAYLVEQSRTTWAVQHAFKTLTPPGAFTSSTAMTDDASRVAVSTPMANSPDDGSFVGSVWVYTRAGDEWTPQRLEPNDDDAHVFGRSIAMSGDGSALAVAVSSNVSAGEDGHVYVFTTW